MIAVPAASPSTPSVRFTPFTDPAMIRKSSTYQPGPSGIDRSTIGTKTRVAELLMVRGEPTATVIASSSSIFQRPGARASGGGAAS